MAFLIEFRDVTCFTEGGRVVFDRINLNLSEGERTLVTGPIASGKSLFIKLILGMERPATGSITVLGTDTSALTLNELRGLRKKIGFIVEDNILISNLKVIENVALPLLYHAGLSYNESIRRAATLLTSVCYKGNPWEMPGPLPLYVKKTVAVARSLALDPRIIVCENLSEGLMPSENAFLSDVIVGYQEAQAGRMAVFTAAAGADVSRIKPTRVVRIADNGLVETAGA
ncbi:MAG: ATP-binding cassette domain-containing protein [Deltaproteobacteria bacterium]|nr:ATP-binding cassette domain-containing protein [Deltaproteobacteria bacterium]